MKIVIPKKVWKYHLQIPANFNSNPDLFIERLDYSFEKEGYLNYFHSLEFDGNVSTFLLDYKGFFKENFIDVIIENATNTSHYYSDLGTLTFSELTYSPDGEISVTHNYTLG